MSIPQPLLDELKRVEEGVEFSGSLPRIRSSSGKLYFAKLGASSEAEQFEGEAESLKAIHAGAPGLAPQVFASGVTETGKPFLISEYKDLGSLHGTASMTLAKRLATELHKYTSPKGFGFEVPTYCGATRMENGWFPTWEECYSAKIEELLKYLRKQGADERLCTKGDKVVQEVIPKLLGPLSIQPVLLHGDLWSGNAGTDSETGEPVIFDPSSYYGHNEADLAIARIFGGFSQSFFQEYHKHLPKSEPQEQYELRCDLYEMFHYLNHAVLFGGGGYASSALKKMERLLSANI